MPITYKGVRMTGSENTATLRGENGYTLSLAKSRSPFRDSLYTFKASGPWFSVGADVRIADGSMRELAEGLLSATKNLRAEFVFSDGEGHFFMEFALKPTGSVRTGVSLSPNEAVYGEGSINWAFETTIADLERFAGTLRALLERQPDNNV